MRDRFTWFAYLMAAYFSYLQAALGSLIPFLGDELRMSYTLRGLHFSAFTLDTSLTGLASNRIVQKWGRRFNVWGGVVGMSAGALSLTLSRQATLTSQ